MMPTVAWEGAGLHHGQYGVLGRGGTFLPLIFKVLLETLADPRRAKICPYQKFSFVPIVLKIGQAHAEPPDTSDVPTCPSLLQKKSQDYTQAQQLEPWSTWWEFGVLFLPERIQVQVAHLPECLNN
ncbi:hypothetical protein Y1Q_0012485 [Alligator mississippiensis]|uniref:Uncharacterized protein n=1 Tax=Alligator mississippiensis TaxID=8496 RepID=A0A151M7U3_ALLMI|nr:hypothetical protein Y1Q_0012485 [Alligator mississippiensis]